MAGFARLTVSRYNKKVLTAKRKQDFVCDEMDGVIDVTGGGARFSYRASRTIPGLYQVDQNTQQIRALCNSCCDSNSE